MSLIATFVLPKKPTQRSEDAVFADARPNGSTILAIADGLGGLPNGELASEIAINEVRRRWNAGEAITAQIFDAIVGLIRDAEITRDNPGMGTTLSLAHVEGGLVRVLHVGDCLICHIRDAGIVRLTKPQTEVQKLLDDGVITKTAARRYPRRNVLTSALTARAQYFVQEAVAALLPGDRLLVTSDGVHEVLALQEMRELSEQNREPSTFAQALADGVATRGIRDDYAAIIFDYSP